MAYVSHVERDRTRHSVDFAARDLGVDRPELSAFSMQKSQDCARSLSALIQSEIIPRLIAVHARSAPCVGIGEIAPLDAADIEDMASLVMQVDADALLAHVDAVLDRGVTVETVMVDLLAPTARLLGDYWEDDRCDFVDVTMGLWRLQEVVHEIAGRTPAGCGVARGHRALFASMPGDLHSFGAMVIDEVFRRAGWATERIIEAQTSDLLASAAEDWFDLIGLTISCDCHIAELPSIIAALRGVSSNPQVCIMVGGRLFSANPDLAVRVGADGTARDAKLALETAGALVRRREWEAAACS